jgi:hypothetical protein
MQTYDANKKTTEVRQGDRRRMTLRVLVIATLAVVVAFALIWVFFSFLPQGNVIQ